jgi:hypothetical protein
MNNEYSEETLKEDIKSIKEKSDLDTITVNLLINFIETKDSLKGTYDEILQLAQKQEKKEQKMCDIVNQFLTQINDNTKTINKKNTTANFDSTFSKFSHYTSKDWKLVAQQESDSLFIVEATSKTHNSLGRPIDIIQRFALTNQYGNWQIWNSYGLMALHLDFDIVDLDWDFFWDRKKYEILTQMQEKIKLEIIRKGYSNRYSDSRKGELRLINDSEYDIKGVRILIEHFDNNGKSVNTDKESVWNIIRKNGYREFDWFTSDCAKCLKQKFTISFIKEY